MMVFLLLATTTTIVVMTVAEGTAASAFVWLAVVGSIVAIAARPVVFDSVRHRIVGPSAEAPSVSEGLLVSEAPPSPVGEFSIQSSAWSARVGSVTSSFEASEVRLIMSMDAAPRVTDSPPVDDDAAVIQRVLKNREQRRRAREIAEQDPAMAEELGIGRPDLARSYDDGGLIDLNNAPAGAIKDVLDWEHDVARTFVAEREVRRGYSSLDEIGALSSLDPMLLADSTDQIIVLPYRSTT